MLADYLEPSFYWLNYWHNNKCKMLRTVFNHELEANDLQIFLRVLPISQVAYYKSKLIKSGADAFIKSTLFSPSLPVQLTIAL